MAPLWRKTDRLLLGAVEMKRQSRREREKLGPFFLVDSRMRFPKRRRLLRIFHQVIDCDSRHNRLHPPLQSVVPICEARALLLPPPWIYTYTTPYVGPTALLVFS